MSPASPVQRREVLSHLFVWVLCTALVLVHLYSLSEVMDRHFFRYMWHFFLFPFVTVAVGRQVLSCSIWDRSEEDTEDKKKSEEGTGAKKSEEGTGDKKNEEDIEDKKSEEGTEDKKKSPTRAEEHVWSLFMLLLVLSVCMVAVLGTGCFFTPFGEFDKMDQAEDAISRTKAPGVRAPINCMTDENPESIDVRTDLYSYFTLANPQWSVGLNWTEVLTQYGETWAVAPILSHNGTCETKNPLFVACVGESISSAKCSWGNERGGAWTDMRLLTASHEIEEGDMEKFWGKFVPNPYNITDKVRLHDGNLFQYNSPSYDETVEFLDDKRHRHKVLKWVSTVGWLVGSTLVAVLAFVFYLQRVRNLPPPSTAEPASCEDASAAAPQNNSPYGV